MNSSTNTPIKVTSFNVNGLGQEGKQNATFNKMKTLECIVFIHETHSTPSMEKKWKNEWGGHIIYSHALREGSSQTNVIYSTNYWEQV